MKIYGTLEIAFDFSLKATYESIFLISFGSSFHIFEPLYEIFKFSNFQNELNYYLR